MAKVVYTQKMFYEEVMAAMADNANVVAMCEKKLAQLDTKSSKTNSAKSTEQRAVMDMIIAVLCANDKPMKCGDICKAVNAENGTEYSPSKINAMLRKLLPSDEKNPDGTGEVIRTTDKKDVFFSLAD
jgi:hypothetical protein